MAAVKAQEHAQVDSSKVPRRRPQRGVRAAKPGPIWSSSPRALRRARRRLDTVRVAEQTGADVVTAASRWSADAGTGIRPPEGGPAVAGLFYRCFGDAGYMIRRDARSSASAASTPRRRRAPRAHHLLCRAALEGYRIEIVPEPLIRERLGKGVTPARRSTPDREPLCVPTRSAPPTASRSFPDRPRAVEPRGSKDAQIKGILTAPQSGASRPRCAGSLQQRRRRDRRSSRRAQQLRAALGQHRPRLVHRQVRERDHRAAASAVAGDDLGDVGARARRARRSGTRGRSPPSRRGGGRSCSRRARAGPSGGSERQGVDVVALGSRSGSQPK